jgi:DNA-binding SARP family transcriptional activator
MDDLGAIFSPSDAPSRRFCLARLQGSPSHLIGRYRGLGAHLPLARQCAIRAPTECYNGYAMDFRILGPLEVWDRGRPIELRRPKHRALLAALLLRAGQAVSVDQLLDDLWGEQPPPTAKGSLQNTVSALRKVLGNALLRTEAPGYLLDIERERVDLFRFERLLEEARDATSAEERIERLRGALALWRGPPLADLAFEPFVLLEAPHIEELRIAAREELIEARLALGHELELIPELEALVAKHPFNERLRGQLMLALYRAGRQAEALELYRQGRYLLVEELGLEPSTPLRELEQAILRQDSSLAPAHARRPSLVPTRKTATVLYADLVSSGALAGELDPEALDQLISRCSTAAQQAIERHGGTHELLGGGAFLAVFGVPRAHEDDALRAVRAAVDLRTELEALGAEFEPRIGISTGEVFVGGLGSAALVTGAVVNVAKRLGDAAAAAQIVLGATTVRLVRGAVTTETLEPLRVGEPSPLGVWRLLEMIEGAPAIPRRFEAPLVGRRPELGELRSAFDATRTDSLCRLLVLVGEPGIGKTRLAREFANKASREATVLLGRCASYGQGATWLPLREILREGGAGTPESLSSLLSGEQDGQLVARRIAGLIDASEEAASFEETQWAARRLFEALARERPLLLVFEDVHWAEPALLDLIEHLGERAAGPILVLCLTRPELLETRTDWARAQRAITLAALLETDVGALVDSLNADLDSEARARVVEVAEGNPLFAEQLVAHAQEEGSESLHIAPPSIEALLSSRIDLLSAEERALLQRAAVIGRRFSRAAVVELLAPADIASVRARLCSLIKKGFIRTGAPGDSLSFHHVLVRNVAYAGIPKGVRAELHERAADWLDRDAANPDELVGYHLEQACRYRSELRSPDEHALDLGRRAAERLAAAAERAFAGDDMRAAASLIARAEDLLPRQDPLRLQLLTRLGEALEWLGELGPAAAVLGEAIEGAKTAHDARIKWNARLEDSFVTRLSDHQAWCGQARREAERAIEACEELEYEEGLAKAWQLLAILEGDLGHNRAAAEALERALPYARRSHDERAERRILGLLAYSAVLGPMPVADAIRLLEGHQELARARGFSHWEANCDELLAVLWAMRGQFGKARAMLAEARALREDLGVRGAGWASAAAVVERLAGDPGAAERASRAAYRVYEEQGSVAFASATAAELAYVLQAQNRDDEALQLTERSEEEMAAGDVIGQTFWRRARARVLARRGAFDEAERLAGEAVQLGSATDEVLLRGDALADLAAVLHLAGRAEEAVRALEQALPLYEQKGNLVSGGRARYMLEEIKTGGPATRS